MSKHTIETITDGKVLTVLLRGLRESGERHELLKEAGLYLFWGATCYVLRDKHGAVLSLNQTRFSKSRNTAWRPYANFYMAYTPEPLRHKGYAKELLTEVERMARDVGCRRLKSLAGSAGGLGLHLSRGHVTWGRTEKHEICIDTPLVDNPEWEGRVPPSVVATKVSPERVTTPKELWAMIKKDPLRYDRVVK